VIPEARSDEHDPSITGGKLVDPMTPEQLLGRISFAAEIAMMQYVAGTVRPNLVEDWQRIKPLEPGI
jgi:hypothetical protein